MKMRGKATHAIGWMLIGMILMGVIVWFAMPSVMIIKHKSSHNYDDTIAILSDAIKSRPDWRVLDVNDYQKSTSAFATIERSGSISICNPRYAAQVLANDQNRGVTAFMPLVIGVYEDKTGQVYIANLNVKLLGMMFGGTIGEVMGKEAGTDINAAIESAAGRQAAR
jgi:uncharacterized protein (DUF302 family)